MNKLAALFVVMVAIHCTCADSKSRDKKKDGKGRPLSLMQPTKINFERSNNNRCILVKDKSPPPKTKITKSKKKFKLKGKRSASYTYKKKLIDPKIYGHKVEVTIVAHPPDAPVKCNPCEPNNPCGPGDCSLELASDKKGRPVLSTTCSCPVGYCGDNCKPAPKATKTDTFCRDKSDCALIQTAQCKGKTCVCPCNTMYVSARKLLSSKGIPARPLCVQGCPDGQELGENFKKHKGINLLEGSMIQLKDLNKFMCQKACLAVKDPLCLSYSHTAKKRRCTLYAASKNDHVAIAKDQKIKVGKDLKALDETTLYTRLCDNIRGGRGSFKRIMVPVVKEIKMKHSEKSDLSESSPVDPGTPTSDSSNPSGGSGGSSGGGSSSGGGGSSGGGSSSGGGGSSGGASGASGASSGGGSGENGG